MNDETVSWLKSLGATYAAVADLHLPLDVWKQVAESEHGTLYAYEDLQVKRLGPELIGMEVRARHRCGQRAYHRAVYSRELLREPQAFMIVATDASMSFEALTPE